MCDDIGMDLLENILINMTMLAGGSSSESCGGVSSHGSVSRLRVIMDAIETIHTARVWSGRDQNMTEVIKQVKRSLNYFNILIMTKGGIKIHAELNVRK